LNDQPYLIQDDKADLFYKRWKKFSPAELVEVVVGDFDLWDYDLSLLPEFEQSVADKLNLLMKSGAKKAIENILSKNYHYNES